MKSSSAAAAIIAILGALAGVVPLGADADPESPAAILNLEPFADSTGAVATFNASGRIDTRGAFFQSLGTNGRSCATCHAADQAFGISPPQVRERFKAS